MSNRITYEPPKRNAWSAEDRKTIAKILYMSWAEGAGNREDVYRNAFYQDITDEEFALMHDYLYTMDLNDIIEDDADEDMLRRLVDTECIDGSYTCDGCGGNGCRSCGGSGERYVTGGHPRWSMSKRRYL